MVNRYHIVASHVIVNKQNIRPPICATISILLPNEKIPVRSFRNMHKPRTFKPNNDSQNWYQPRKFSSTIEKFNSHPKHTILPDISVDYSKKDVN